jgi:hypothetical protein
MFEISRSHHINRFVEVFSIRERSHDNAPTARNMPARGNAPGTCPSPCPALQGRSNRVCMRKSNLCGTRLQPRRKWSGFRTALAAGSSTDEFSHRLESSALSGRTDRFRKPRRRPWLESGGAFNAGIKIVQLQIHEYCWLAIYSRGLPVGHLVPRSVRTDPPQTPLCVQELNFRLADYSSRIDWLWTETSQNPISGQRSALVR